MIKNNLQFSIFLLVTNLIALVLLVSSLMVETPSTKKTLTLFALGILIFQKALEFFLSIEKKKKLTSLLILICLVVFFIFSATR